MNKLKFLNKELDANYKSLDDVDWESISIEQKLSDDFIRKFQDYIDWYWVSIYQKLSEELILEF